MSTADRMLVPVGPNAARWRTISPHRTVLVIVHTVTAWNRFADILPVFDSDRRVQLVFTFPDASAVSAGIEEQLARQGVRIIPWERAVTVDFDLALSAHHSGDLHKVRAALVVLSHGMGYTKYSNRDTGTPGHRDTGTPGHRDTGTPGHRDTGTPGHRDTGTPMASAPGG
ncbi:hypothetical protein F1D05_10070 [Kribbella qitaiheensis]|uniref:Uncharacterized protein n=1 Tax=Kribbella qitaiheensis TaxID=1544730 RepID=A0A7G6WW11_9ACTN|nr:hypothetical protein [Kribbella qitaiheensis]QNE18176.1 hypothetical protein F1D05_10070 [Kribbella qitaiheensis]